MDVRKINNVFVQFQVTRLITNLCLLPNRFEMTPDHYQMICIYLAIYIYGTWVFEIYKPIKEEEEKERAEFKELLNKCFADLTSRMVENDARNDNDISEKDPGMGVW